MAPTVNSERGVPGVGEIKHRRIIKAVKIGRDEYVKMIIDLSIEVIERRELFFLGSMEGREPCIT